MGSTDWRECWTVNQVGLATIPQQSVQDMSRGGQVLNTTLDDTATSGATHHDDPVAVPEEISVSNDNHTSLAWSDYENDNARDVAKGSALGSIEDNVYQEIRMSL